MSVITGDAVPAVRDMEDEMVVDECMKVLRELFKEQVKPCNITFLNQFFQVLLNSDSRHLMESEK